MSIRGRNRLPAAPTRGVRTALLAAGVSALLGATSACSATGSSSPPAAHPTVAPGPADAHVVRRIGTGVELTARSTAVSAKHSPALAPVARAERAFTVALLHQLGSSDQNTSVSPASLGLALAMLQNGAAGRTRTQITDALQAHGTPIPDQDAGWAALAAQWRAGARSGAFHLQSANSTWVQRGFPVRAAFLSDLARYFGTGVWQVDYAHGAGDALAAINSWTSRQTHGKIRKLFDQLDPSTVLVLANAVYFQAAWQRPFDPSFTQRGAFILADGSSTQAQFMAEAANLPAVTNDAYQAVQLPYRGGRFAALAIMPRSGTLADFVEHLSAPYLTKILSGLSPQHLSLRMPRFATTSTLDLVPVLAALGMTDAFSDHADFSALSPRPLSVSQATQRVYLSVAEKGTEAAAATGLGLTTSGVAAQRLRQVDLDHPFLFLIRDTKTGAVLFASEVQNPAAG